MPSNSISHPVGWGWGHEEAFPFFAMPFAMTSISKLLKGLKSYARTLSELLWSGLSASE